MKTTDNNISSSNSIMQPTIEQIRAAYQAGSEDIKSMLRTLYGDAVDGRDTRPVTERIKTFEDACRELGDDNLLVEHYRLFEEQMSGCYDEMSDIEAYLKARIIVAALNEGWVPSFEQGEWRYAPYFRLYTEQEIDELDEEDRQNIRRVVGRSSGIAYASGGLAYADAFNVSSSSDSYSGSRLAFRSEKLAVYAGKQFIEIFGTLAFL